MAKNKAIFLDRDGTINVDKGYIYKVEDLEFLPNSIKGLKCLQQAGYKLIIVTNQSGIGRGIFNEKDYKIFAKEFLEKLSNAGVHITADYYCSHAPEENCNCRKPKIKFIDDAAKKYEIDLKKSFFVGDKETDVLTGKNSKMRTILISSNEKETEADFVCRDIKEASEVINKVN